MIEFAGRALLLDVEGTTSSIRFVYDVLFPFARRELDAFLGNRWRDPEVRGACEQIARDAGAASLAAWLGEAAGDASRARRLVRDEVLHLMDADAKATGLKTLQGLIWRTGFEGGELRSHVYDDVPVALRAWRDAACDVRIYSSGSIAAQKLFFGHTIAGDLGPLLGGHYDTTTGPKRQSASYRAIAEDYGCAPQRILFVSDVPAELDAAHAAGMTVALCVRPGNAEAREPRHHPVITSFDQVRLR